MTDDVTKKAGESMMDDLIPGRKAKREAKEERDRREAASRSYGYSNRDYWGGRGNYSSGYSRQGSLLDDDGLDPMDSGYGGYSRQGYSGRSNVTQYPSAVGVGTKTNQKKLEALAWDWHQKFSKTHGLIERKMLDKIVDIMSEEVSEMFDSANLTWGSQSGNKLRAILEKFILEECNMYNYATDIETNQSIGYKPIAIVDSDGVIHETEEDHVRRDNPVVTITDDDIPF